MRTLAFPLYFALALGLAALPSPASAQVDYSFNWHTPNDGFTGTTLFADGPGLFGTLSGDGHYATTGDSLRICYSIDQSQGGCNADGTTEVTWINAVSAFDPANTIQDVDLGLITIGSASVDSLDGDACFNPFFNQGVDSMTGAPITLNTTTSFSFVPGLMGLPALPFPTFWDIEFQMLGPSGVQVPNTLGVQPGAVPNPLLANLVLDFHGPANAGPQANHFYAASTGQTIGLGVAGVGTGGVTNGNGRQGKGMSGVSADLSGAVNFHRVFATSTIGSVLSGSFGTTDLVVGDTQWLGGLGTATPSLWAAKDGATGAGARDLSIGNSVSTLQWRLTDHLAGAEGNPTSAAFNPNLVANFAFAMFSTTPAAGMLQQPLSWDDLGGVLPASPGSIVLGAQATTRKGPQTLPANFDALTNSFLNSQPGFTFGSAFSASADPVVDLDPVPISDRGIGLTASGQSSMPAALPIAVTPNPALVGKRIGVAAFGIQADAQTGITGITEVGNAMTIVLQP